MKYVVKENQVKAFNRLIRISVQKLGLVCDMVRGLSAEKAIDILKFSKKRVASEVLKTLMSAVANAENNKKLSPETLFIKEIWCGKALTMKRVMPGPRGSARPILKPFSNLTIILESGNSVKENNKGKEKK